MKKQGIIWKNEFCPYWGGIYLNTTQKFFRGGLDDISRALKAEVNDAGVIEVYESTEDTTGN